MTANEGDFSIVTETTRRVIKAKAPPSPSSLRIPEAAEEEEISETHVSYAVKSPSLAREREQEQEEEYLNKRLSGLASKQKSSRGKGFNDRRQGNSTPTQGLEKNNTSDIPQEVLETFSVEPKHPEHKRSGNEAQIKWEGEPQGKRRKASVDEGPEENGENGPVSKVVLVSALVAAVAIGMALFQRKRGSAS